MGISLIELTRIASSANSLLSGGALNTALDAIAEVDIETAKYAIRNHSRYVNPKDALKTALDNLTHAHYALKKKWSSYMAPATLGPFLLELTKKTDAYVCCLISIMHYALGNSTELSSDALYWAETALDSIDSSDESFEETIKQMPARYLGIIRVFTDLYNPSIMKKTINNDLSESDMYDFIRKMRDKIR